MTEMEGPVAFSTTASRLPPPPTRGGSHDESVLPRRAVCFHARRASSFALAAVAQRQRHLQRAADAESWPQDVSHLLRAPGDCIIEIALFLPLQDVRSLLGTCKSVAGYLGNAAGRDFWATLAATRLLSRPDLSSMNGACCSATWFRNLYDKPEENVARIDLKIQAAKAEDAKVNGVVSIATAALDAALQRNLARDEKKVALTAGFGMLALVYPIYEFVAMPLLPLFDSLLRTILCQQCQSHIWLVPTLCVLPVAMCFSTNDRNRRQIVSVIFLGNVLLWVLAALSCHTLFDVLASCPSGRSAAPIASSSCACVGNETDASIPLLDGRVVSNLSAAWTAAEEASRASGYPGTVLFSTFQFLIVALFTLPITLIQWLITTIWFGLWIVRTCLLEVCFPLFGPLLAVARHLLINRVCAGAAVVALFVSAASFSWYVRRATLRLEHASASAVHAVQVKDSAEKVQALARQRIQAMRQVVRH